MEYLIRYGVLITFFISLVFTATLHYRFISRKKQHLSTFVLLLLIFLLALPYYLVQFPFSLFYLFSLPFIFWIQFAHKKRSWMISLLLYSHSLMMIYGLASLNSPANTWGNFALLVGIFIVVQSGAILMYLSTIAAYSRQIGWLKLLVSVLCFLLIALNVFPDAGFNGQGESFMRLSSLVVCAVLFYEGLTFIHFPKYSSR